MQAKAIAGRKLLLEHAITGQAALNNVVAELGVSGECAMSIALLNNLAETEAPQTLSERLRAMVSMYLIMAPNVLDAGPSGEYKFAFMVRRMPGINGCELVHVIAERSFNDHAGIMEVTFNLASEIVR